MRKQFWFIGRAVAIVAAICAVVVFMFGSRLMPIQGQTKATTSFAAVPGEKGGQDISGPYDVDPNWPKPMSQLPGHDNWTWGSVNGVFAQDENRVFVVQRGEVPLVKRPAAVALPQFGPGISFLSGVPFHNAGQGPISAPLGPPDEPNDWKGKYGVDGRWEHCLVVIDGSGKIVESWTQWDKTFKHPHAIYVNPYDPQKSVWVVDDFRHAVFKFSNDGEKLLMTIGTPNIPGNDEKHLNRPTFLAWLPDSTMYLGDGYVNTRVLKFDKDGKYLTSWGQKGNPPNETRGGYFNTVHGVAVDPVTRKVYVTDRENRRTEVFDENGKISRSMVLWTHLFRLFHLSGNGPAPLGRRCYYVKNSGIRSGRTLPIFVGHQRRLAGVVVGRARDERRSAGKFLCVRSGSGTRTEIQATSWRESKPVARQTVRSGEIGLRMWIREVLEQHRDSCLCGVFDRRAIEAYRMAYKTAQPRVAGLLKTARNAGSAFSADRPAPARGPLTSTRIRCAAARASGRN